MKNKPNTRIGHYTFQELPLRELFCGVLMSTSLFAGISASVDADESDVQTAYPASQFGVFDEDVTLSAAGGDASAEGANQANAGANAEAVGIDGELLADVSSVADFSATVDLSAIGGSAFAAASEYAFAEAAGFVSAVGYIEGDFSGAIQGVATGGLAESFMADEVARAYANALAVGIDGLSGDSTGSIAVTATGGTANAGYELLDFMIPDDVEAVALSISEEGSANASAVAIASDSDGWGTVFDSIEGNPIEEEPQLINGSYSATATGGEATANGFSLAAADASAFASANVINDDFQGEIDAEFIASATGGTAAATAADAFFVEADASAEANGLSGLFSIDGSLAGTIEAQATGGAATVSSDFGDSLADAGARAVGLQFSDNGFELEDELESEAYYFDENVIFGDVAADITVVATSGEAGHTNGGYMFPDDEIEGDNLDYVNYGALSDAYAAGIDSVSEIYGDVTGSINASAFGGEAVSLTSQTIYSDELESDQFDGGVYANASAEAVGIAGLEDYYYKDAIEGDFYDEDSVTVFGEVSSDITAVAVAGNALVGGSFDSSSEVYAGAVATGIDGDVIAESMLISTDSIESDDGGPLATALSGSFDVSAFGGGAYSVPGFGSQIYYMNEYDVIESIVIYSDQFADASAFATAVDGDVVGSVDADFTVNAVGGFAYEQGNFGYGPSSDYVLLAGANAAGISGSVWGDFTGDMQVNAAGGIAMLQSSNYYGDSDEIEGDDFFLEDAYVDASAVATGIGSSYEAIYGEISGDISVAATGGTVAIIYDDFYAVDELEGDYTDGLYLPEAPANAYAQAIALSGAVYSEDISGDLTATAVGGLLFVQDGYPMYSDSIESVGASSTGSVDAFAAGIVGAAVDTMITGSVTAIATPGVYGYSESYYPSDALEGDVIPGLDLSQSPEIPEPDYSQAANGYAIGVMGAGSSYAQPGDDIEGVPSGSSVQLSISNSVHAIVLQPELVGVGVDDEIESGEAISNAYNSTYNAYAAAVYGGSDDDFVLLAEGANIIGDINLNGGENELYVVGDTIMQGDILSSSDERVEYGLDIYNGYGTVDFNIEAGLFTAVGTVNVSDLESQIDIASGAGLAPLISRDSEFSSLINVFGDEADVVFAEDSIVRPTFNGMEDWSDVLASEDEDDKKFLIVSSTGSIDADNAILDGSRSPFEITFLKEDGTILLPNDLEALVEEGSGENLFVALGDVITPTGDETPGASQTVQAANVSSRAVMIDISKRASLMRSMLRGTVAYSGESPEGAAGPDAERMQNGEWLSYISAFGNIGKQENVNGAVGFDYDTYGFVIGQEKLLGDSMIIGIAGSYAQTDVEGNNGFSGGDTDLYSGAFYANWFTDTWYTEVGLTYGHAETETRRKDVSSIRYTGDYDSNLYGTWVEVGYTTTYEGLEAEPYARVSYVYGDHEGFTDSGAGPNSLTTKDTNTQNFQTEIGIRLTEEWVFEDDSRFFLGFKAAWEHEWADQNVRLDAEYLGAEINIESAEADRAALVLGIRGEWRSANGLSLGLKYEPSIAGNWMNHAFSGTLQYNW
ncbi:autotransporter outer membrane beta-barrel domain-containing protein [Coraliomargarita sp. W4R72]